jgi:hypothetical protein
MNHPLPLDQTLTFDRVEYSVEQVQHWLSQSEIDAFVFEFYFPVTEDPNRPFLLCCYARNTQDGYYNPLDPDILNPFPREALVQSGPLKLAGSFVTAEAMSNLLAGDPTANFLLFTPTLTDYQQVMYTITTFRQTATGVVFGSGSINTNPSPPATVAVTENAL